MKRVNDKGLREVLSFLNARHKYLEYIDDVLLTEFLKEAEHQMEIGKSPTIEITHYYSMSGLTEIYIITDDGLSEEI